MKKNLAAVFNKTKFKNAPMIPVAAAPGGKDSNEKLGLQELINELEKHILLPEQKIKQNEGNVSIDNEIYLFLEFFNGS